jgi:hypothetical protein
MTRDGVPQVTVTARYLLDHGLWVRACEMTGLNEWAVNEGRMDAGETVTLTLAQAAELGLLDASEPARERPHRIDPLTCGCTDCMLGWSVLSRASDEDVFAMLAGEIQDATSEEFATVTNADWSGSVTVRARWCGREWTRAAAPEGKR